MSLERVREYFKKFGIENRIKVLPESSATVALAAHALGTEEKRIAKTLSFHACGSGNSAIEMTIDEIEKYSGYIAWIDVTKLPE